jgi:hypothetical protein
MNPIEDGPTIFKKVAENFSTDELKSATQVKSFFDILLSETDGSVIVDFLDTSNWDSISGYEFNEKSKFLFLYWHDYREVDTNKPDDEPEEIRLVFPASLYGLFMHFHSIRIIRTEYHPLFLLRGYALTDKEIKRALVSSSEEYRFGRDSFFSKLLYRKIDNHWQVLTCHNTPIYSTLIIPKRSKLKSLDSKIFLYECNIHLVMEKLQNLQEALSVVGDDETDVICEKANTIRRTLENVLKIEGCYREVELKKAYSQLQIGDLWGVLKDYHPESIRFIFGKLIEWSNELSHDSGIPVKKEKAEALSALAMAYVELLRLEIDNKYSSSKIRR